MSNLQSESFGSMNHTDFFFKSELQSFFLNVIQIKQNSVIQEVGR